jgi:hypothetical protein
MSSPSSERRVRILGQLVRAGEAPPETARLCEVCAEMTDTSGAGIMLIADGTSRGSICTSNSVSEVIEELQFTLGEGPCIDACREGRPILEPDLASPARQRWVAFAPPAIAAGARAVFGFPVRVGAAHLGALNLYRDRPGPLTDDQHADALVLADVAAELVLLLQAGAPPGELAMELEASASLHYVVHQASGMVSVQLGVAVEHAMVRLRAFAFVSGRPLIEVARSVVDRTLRFDPTSETGIGK